jgi:DNA-binding CsgD family transcriptional regulator/tetratricopeptide (TPR) repeat protein
LSSKTTRVGQLAKKTRLTFPKHFVEAMIIKNVRSEVLVGRTRELEHLRDSYARADRGEGNLVIIVGTSGIGKSRLLREFLTELSPEKSWRTIAQCLDYVRSPYMPFLEMLHGLFPAADIADHAKEERSIAWVLNRWTELSSPHDSLTGMRDRQKLAEFRTTFSELQALSRVRPVVVVIEDVHWADIASTELLQFINHGIRDTRLFIIVTARAEPIDQAHPISQVFAHLQRDGASRIDLDRLSNIEIRACLQNAMQMEDLPLETIQQITELADGNPLYAEELLCTALARHDLSRANNLPLSLRSSVIERLRQFDPAERDIIEQASVIGRTFDSELVGRLVNQPPGLINRALRKAKMLHLIAEHDTMPVSFAFRHALIREIVYRELLAAETLPRHEWIAKELEARDPLPVAELAYHWAAAGNAEKAVRYNLLAADVAASAFAHADVVRFLKSAYHFLRRPSPESADLCERLATTCYVAGQSEDARRWTDQAIDQFEHIGMTAKIPVMLTHLARIRNFSGNTKDSLQLAFRALELVDEKTTLEQEVLTRLFVARFEVLLTHWQEAELHLATIEQYLEELGPSLQASFYDVRGMARANLGAVSDGLADLDLSLAIASSAGDIESEQLALNNAGFVLSWLGRNAEAIERYRRALASADAKGYIVRAGFDAFGMVRALLRQGDLPEARRMVDLGLERATTPLIELMLAEVGIPIGLLIGDESLIRRSSTPGVLEAVLNSESSERVGAVASAYVDLAIARGHREEACDILERAIASVESAAQSWWLLCQVALYGKKSSIPVAEELLVRAAAVSGHTVAQAYLHLFRACKTQRSGAAGQTDARAAAALFKSMGWSLLEAKARDLAGDNLEALALYRAAGATEEVRRIEATQPKKRTRGRANTELTPREAEVAAFVAMGKSNREISRELNISENTVGHHLESIFNRLDIRSRAQLAGLVGSGALTLPP